MDVHNRVKQKDLISKLTFFLIAIMASYGVLLRGQASVDYYQQLKMVMDGRVATGGSLSLGRFVPALFTDFANMLHFYTTNTVFQTAWLLGCTLLAMGTIYYSMKNVSNVLSEYSNLCALCSAMIFINPFYVEWMLFPDGYIMFGISVVVLGAYAYCISGKMGKARWILASVLLFTAVNSYQANIGTCFIFTIFFRWLYHGGKPNKKFFIDITIGIGLMLLMAASNIGLIKMVQVMQGAGDSTGRGPELNLGTFIHNLEIITLQQGSIMRNAMGLMNGPWVGALCAFIGIAMVGQCVILVRHKQLCKAVVMVILMLLMYCASFAAQAISSHVWLAHRTIVPFFAMCACCVLMISLNSPSFVERISKIIVAVFLMVSIIANQNICVDRVLTNRFDILEAKAVAEEIASYEMEKGIDINKICIKHDPATSWAYPMVRSSYDINVRAMAYDIPAFNLISIIAKDDMALVNINDTDFPLPLTKNWDDFSIEEQLYIDGDTAYLILY